MERNIRRGRGKFLGMDLLILYTQDRPGIPGGPTHPAVTAYSGPLPRPLRHKEVFRHG
jgi:hypothetical protein